MSRIKKVLLINPNRYQSPPVIPLGLEYLAHALTGEGLQVRVLDLCFASDPISEAEKTVADFVPDALCVTVRNVDTVLTPETEFFLPDIRALIDRLRELSPAPVIIGGAALAANPEGMRDFLGADLAVVGPGEKSLPEVLLGDGGLQSAGKVLRGERPPDAFRRRCAYLDYAAYRERDGIGGFETHKGCSSGCVYCIEARTPVFLRKPEQVVSELEDLVEHGNTHLHLCDPEFNEDLEACLAFLERLLGRELPLRWALYMKPGNHGGRFFSLLKKTGAYLITLSVDSFQRPVDYWRDVVDVVRAARAEGLRLSIDFLTGFPGEDEDHLKRTLHLLHAAGPDEVVVNATLRLYRSLPLTGLIQRDPSLGRYLFGATKDPSCLTPVFYRHVEPGRLKELLGGDALFRIAGEEKAVNYQKAERPSLR
jgi:radical SAM superfamily enzyme YgiQ (UPF0313 family)